MKNFAWLWLLGTLALAGSGCVVVTDDCDDSDLDGVCDEDDCAPGDPDVWTGCGCVDNDGDGWCAVDDCDDNDAMFTDDCPCVDVDLDGHCFADDCDDNDAAVWDDCGCIDDDLDGHCFADDCDDLDPLVWDVCGCTDTDWDGICDENDCAPNDYKVWDCDCSDIDLDGICDEDDVSECVDDKTGEWLCGTECTALDNVCTDTWVIDYCVDGQWYVADCAESCAYDPEVYDPVCGGPAATGECSTELGACVCWCQDSSDGCVDDWTVRYTDGGGTTYEVHCGQYCGGFCDADSGACICPE